MEKTMIFLFCAFMLTFCFIACMPDNQKRTFSGKAQTQKTKDSLVFVQQLLSIEADSVVQQTVLKDLQGFQIGRSRADKETQIKEQVHKIQQLRGQTVFIKEQLQNIKKSRQYLPPRDSL